MINYLLAVGETDARTIASGILMCIVAALSVALIVLVLLQKGSGDGVSAITGNRGFDNDSEIGAGKKKLRLLTIIFSVILAVVAIVFFAIVPTATTAA